MTAGAARFVVQEHHTEPLHWDLMIERDGALATWALESEPPAGAFEMAARRLPDHRLAYLEKEGEVSGGRGWTRLWDGGVCEAAWQEQRVDLELRGRRLSGRFIMEPTGRAEEGTWTFRRI